MVYYYIIQASPVDPVGKGLFLAVTGWAPNRLYCRPPPPRASWRTTWQCSGVQDDVLIPSDMTSYVRSDLKSSRTKALPHAWFTARHGLFPRLPQETTCQASWWSMECPWQRAIRWSWWIFCQPCKAQALTMVFRKCEDWQFAICIHTDPLLFSVHK